MRTGTKAKAPLCYKARVLLLLIACAGASPDAEEQSSPKEPVVRHEKLDPVMLQQAQRELVAPSPSETRLAVEKAGLGQLGELVPDRGYKLDIPDKDRVALRTGVLLADVVLTVSDAETGQLVARLRDLQTGLGVLGATEKMVATVGQVADQLENDSITRDDLLKTLDEAMGGAQTDLGEYGRFVQAGAWLAGSNLVARAVLADFEPSGVVTRPWVNNAAMLLQQPEVARYYLDYIRSEEGRTKVGADTADALEATLATLLEVSEKSWHGMRARDVQEDVELIQRETQKILDLI